MRDEETLIQGFLEFWSAFPRKRGKLDAFKAWKKLDPTIEVRENILRAIEEQKKCRQWRKDNGEYIPWPASWIRKGGWLDELGPSDFYQARL